MGNSYIAMDDSPVHFSDAVDPIILEKECIPLYIPLYSSKLNPTKMFWKVLKDRVKRGELIDTEALFLRVIEVAMLFLSNTYKISTSTRSRYSLNA